MFHVLGVLETRLQNVVLACIGVVFSSSFTGDGYKPEAPSGTI
jgi:hypothetical protein